MKRAIQDRVDREKLAHDNDGVLEESYKLKDRFHHIWSYPSRVRLETYRDKLLRDISGCDILDYGCGWGDYSEKYYLSGANVTGIDISDNFIRSAKAAFELKKYDRARYRFLQMDAHELEFDAESFDVVVGDGILHHLDANIALSEIYRVLKPGGRVLLFEPLAGNPLLKVFRLLTPSARTVDEKPLAGVDLQQYADSHNWYVEHVFCGVLEAPVAVLTSVIMPSRPDNLLLKVADSLERRMTESGVLLPWNQYVLLNFKKHDECINT